MGNENPYLPASKIPPKGLRFDGRNFPKYPSTSFTGLDHHKYPYAIFARSFAWQMFAAAPGPNAKPPAVSCIELNSAIASAVDPNRVTVFPTGSTIQTGFFTRAHAALSHTPSRATARRVFSFFVTHSKFPTQLFSLSPSK